MSTNFDFSANFAQATRILELINETKPTMPQVQALIENGSFLQQLVSCPDLSKVDKSAFAALLRPQLTIPWTPKDELVQKIMDRSNLRGWGFTLADAKKLAKKLLKHEHIGDLQPTSVRLWLGKDLAFNYTEIILWIKDEVEKLGKKFKEYGDYVNRLSFLDGSEIVGEKFMDVCDFDLLWDKANGIFFGDIKSSRKAWPSLEVLILLALNPQVYIMMDGKTVPFIIAPGFVVDSDSLLICHFIVSEAYVNVYCEGNRWYCYAFVAFR